MKCWTCPRTNSSNCSHVLLAFGSGVVGFAFSMTRPPSLPGPQPGGLGREDTPPDLRLHTFWSYLNRRHPTSSLWTSRSGTTGSSNWNCKEGCYAEAYSPH